MMEQTSGAMSLEMPVWECLDLLAGRHIGRVCVLDGGYPLAFPISYRLTRHEDADALVFRTAAHTAIARHDGQTSLQIDEIDEEHGRAWSVIARGRLRRIAGAHNLVDPHPFVDVGRHTWTVLRIEAISGRRFVRAERGPDFAVEWQVTTS